MTDATARALPLGPASAPAPSRPAGPRLRALPAPAAATRRRPRVLYAAVALLGALAIAATQMGLSIAMTEGGYVERTLAQEQRQLELDRQSATDALSGLTSPQFLAANAASLGMVITESPAYLRLSDGAILGTGAAAGASAVDVGSRGSVQNDLLQGVPLVTDPAETLAGHEATPETPATGDVVPDTTAAGISGTATDASATDPAPEPVAPALPPSLTDGLPSPATR